MDKISKNLLKVFLYGYFFLFSAIFLNLVSNILGLTNWYEFLKSKDFVYYSFLDLLWLFLFYPLLLGFVAWLALRLGEKPKKVINTKNIIIILAFFFLITFALISLLIAQQNRIINKINSFEECQSAGFPIAEKFPEECYLPDGRSFTRDEGVACTMDAKECPDGSYVGRIPPDCEFAACPDEEEVIFCPEDVKQCPNGSYVGRTPPDCEFSPCPGE